MGTTGTTTVDVSARHRDVWNQVAEELGYGIRWAVDMGEVHEIDSYHDLTYTDADVQKFKINPRTPFEMARRLQAAIDEVNRALETKRQASVAASYNEAVEIPVAVDFSDVRPEEKKMIRHLMVVSNLIDDLHYKQLGTYGYMTQIDWLRGIHPESAQLLERNDSPICSTPKSKDDSFCHALPNFEAQSFGIYPQNTEADAKFCEGLTAEGANPLLRDPMTVLVSGANGVYETAYFHEYWKADVQAIATELEAAAKAIENVGDERALYEYLVAAAQSFRTGDWLESDYKWVALNMKNSKYAIRVGPDETYWDPCQNKAGFEFWFGPVNKIAASASEVYGPHLQAMHDELNRLTPHTDPTPVGDVSIPDFVDIATFTGDAKYPTGGIAGQTLPNWSYEHTGFHQWIMNYYMSSPVVQRQSRQVAEALLHPDTLAYFNPDPTSTDKNVVAHELTHSLGIGPVNQVVDAQTGEPLFKDELDDDGNPKPLTVRDAMGGTLGSITEEVRGETGAIHWPNWKIKSGMETTVQERNGEYVTNLMWALKWASMDMLDQNGAPNTYAQVAAVQLAHLIREGALEYKDGKFKIHFDKYPEAVEKLLVKINTIKRHGDKAAAEALLEDATKGEGYASFHPDQVRAIVLSFPQKSFTFHPSGFENGRESQTPETDSTTTGQLDRIEGEGCAMFEGFHGFGYQTPKEPEIHEEGCP